MCIGGLCVRGGGRRAFSNDAFSSIWLFPQKYRFDSYSPEIQVVTHRQAGAGYCELLRLRIEEYVISLADRGLDAPASRRGSLLTATV